MLLETLKQFQNAGADHVVRLLRERIGADPEHGQVLWTNETLTACIGVDEELETRNGLVVIRTDDITGLEWETPHCKQIERQLRARVPYLGTIDAYRGLESEEMRDVITGASARFGVCFVFREIVERHKFDACAVATWDGIYQWHTVQMATIGTAGEVGGDRCVDLADVTRLEIDTLRCRMLLAMAGSRPKTSRESTR